MPYLPTIPAFLVRAIAATCNEARTAAPKGKLYRAKKERPRALQGLGRRKAGPPAQAIHHRLPMLPTLCPTRVCVPRTQALRRAAPQRVAVCARAAVRAAAAASSGAPARPGPRRADAER